MGDNPLIPNTPVAASYYAERGWATVPVPLRSKIPIGERWQTRTVADMRPEDYQGRNIGIILGAPSGNLHDVDLDAPEAVIAARHLLPRTEMVHGRSSSPGSHGWYVTDTAANVKRYQDPEHDGKPGSTLIELRGTGGQTVAPPSIHESGELIEFVKWPPEPLVIGLPILQRAVAEVAAAAILARHHPQQGSRHDFALALAGMLCHGGYPRDRAEQFIEAVTDASGDPESRDRRRCATDTYARKNGHATTGAPTLARLVPKYVVDLAREWLGLHAPVDIDPWEEPVDPAPPLLPIDPFPVELLPDAVRPWIVDISERIQCPIEFPAASCIVALGAAIGRRCAIRPKRRDDWTVVPNLFGVVISNPGTLKSPPVHEAQKPLQAIEIEAHKEYNRAMETHDIQQAVAEQRRKVIQEDMRKAIRSNQSTSTLEAELGNLPKPPLHRRYILNDVTVEKLGEILNENPMGVLVNRDELVGLLNQMTKDGHECDRSFYLEAWNGDKSFSYDRIGRGTKFIESTCVSVFGTIQPGPLLERIRASIKEGGEADGLIQRFQVLVWPDSPTEWHNIDRYPNSIARESAKELFRRLVAINLPANEDEIPFLRFTDEAQVFFDDWREQLERRIGTRGDQLIDAHISKYRSFMPSLALISHLADWVLMPTGDVPPPVSLTSAHRGAALCERFEQHTRRMYHAARTGADSVDEKADAILLAKIKAGALGEAFAARDVYRKQWTGLIKREDVANALDRLEDLGWVRQEAQQTRGRQRVRWQVNPAALRPKS